MLFRHADTPLMLSLCYMLPYLLRYAAFAIAGLRLMVAVFHYVYAAIDADAYAMIC